MSQLYLRSRLQTGAFGVLQQCNVITRFIGYWRPRCFAGHNTNWGHLIEIPFILTEEDAEEFLLCDHLEEQVAVDVLDGVLLHLVQEPRQELAFLTRIP